MGQVKKINQKQLDILKRANNNNSLVGAYLFCGSAKVGKSDVAFNFIRKINKLCDEQKIEDGVNPDVIVVEPEIEEKAKKKRKKDISIDQIKKAVKKIGYYAYESKYKFLIIKEADRMTNTAANSLLKVIEEPTADTIILLISNNELGILSTIRSRCQTIRFGLASREDIILQLRYENVEFEEDDLQEIANFSQGKIVKARTYLKNPEELELAKKNAQIFRGALKSGIVEGLKLSEELSMDKEKLKEALDDILWSLRDLVKNQLKMGADMRVVRKIASIIEKIIKLRVDISNSNVNQRLQLENFFVQL